MKTELSILELLQKYKRFLVSKVFFYWIVVKPNFCSASVRDVQAEISEDTVMNDNIDQTVEEPEKTIESDSDHMEDISGDDDLSDEEWTPDKVSQKDRLLAGRQKSFYHL